MLQTMQTSSMPHQIAAHHDFLLELIATVLVEIPFAAIRLLQVCGVNRFGAILIAVPPQALASFVAERDDAITSTFGAMVPFGIGREVLVRWNRVCLRKLPDAPPPPRGRRWKLS